MRTYPEHEQTAANLQHSYGRHFAMEDMTIPSEADWRSEPWSIDTPYAYKNFFGKNLAEACDLFVKRARGSQEDLMAMPLACFKYYLHAYIDYLLSDKSEHHGIAAYCFFGIVEYRTDDIRNSGEALRQRVLEVLHRIRTGQQWYGADIEIYGDFSVMAIDAISLIDG